MTPLVSPQWLQQRLGNADLIVLDATLPPVGVVPKKDMRAAYLQAHIPGALFFDIDELSDHSSELPHTLPTAESFAASMSTLGVSDKANIVVYEQGNVFSAPRARWMLRTFGAEQVYLLDGGRQAWVAAGYPTASGPVTRPAATFRADLEPNVVVLYPELLAKLSNGEQVLDARSTGRFSGVDPEPRPGLRSGHMPGATSVPSTDLTTGTRMRSADELRAIFAAKHIDLNAPITTSCGSGVTAAIISLGLELAGKHDTALYDGSWAEYAGRPESVIVRDTP